MPTFIDTNRCLLHFLLSLFILPFSSLNAASTSCDLAKAEACFAQLFDQLPICSAADHSGDLSFRCQHFNILDICFGDNQIRCLPAAIGTAAKIAYQKRVDACLFANKAEGENAISTTSGGHHQRMHPGPPSGLLAPPSELQFISLFGYLQTQCRPRRRLPDGAEKGSNRRSHFRSEQQQSTTAAGGGHMGPNCSATYLDEVMGACEGEMKKRQPPPYMQLERHILLRMKLDASSKLMHFPETRPEDECLMVRSVLSDIFLIHQKFCFHTTVTRCLCERLHFERTCGIQCSNLEAFGLPLSRQLLWNDFRGRLSAAQRPVGGSRAWTGMLTAAALALILPQMMLTRRRG